MKKVFLSFSLLIFSVLYAFGQSGEMSVGIRGGLSIPKIKAVGDNPMSQGYSSRLTGGGGVFFEYRFSELFSIRPGIEFLQEGGKRDGMQAIPGRLLAPLYSQVPAQLKASLPEYMYADFNSKTKFDYLMVPMLAKFGWKLGQDSPFRLHVSAGPFLSFLMGAHQEMTGTSEIYLDKQKNVSINQAISGYVLNQVTQQVTAQMPAGTPQAIIDAAIAAAYPTARAQAPTIGAQDLNRNDDIKSQMNKINCGVTGNVGITYTTGKHNIFLEVGGNYGFMKLQKDAVNGENRIGAGTVMLGYAYQFK